MSEVISFRISDELTTKFKEFCQENNLKSPAAFEMMLNTVELENAKGKIASREAEINDFQHHAYCLNRSYLNALEMCENAEAKIRIEFAKQLDSQLDTIADLREKLKQAEEEKKNAIEESRVVVTNAQEAINNVKNEKEEINNKVADLADKLEKAESQIDNDKEIIELLKDKSGKYEADASAYQEAKITIEELKNTIGELKDNIKDINSEHTIKIKEIELLHSQELSNNKTELQAIIAAKELEIANVKADADRKYFEAQNKYNDELHELKSLNKDLVNEIEKLKEKLAKFEDEQEDKKKQSPDDPDDEGDIIII